MMRLLKRRPRPPRRPGLRTATEAQTWYPGYRERYKTAWFQAHPFPPGERTDALGVRPGYWARGDDGIDAWITDTPDWDRKWFMDNDMLLPRFGAKSCTYWRDYEDGLRGLSYAPSGEIREKR